MNKKWINVLVILSFLGLFSCAKDSHKSASSTWKEGAKPQDTLLLDTDPDYNKAALINVELGLGYLSQGQVTRAKTKLTHAVDLAPNLPETHSAMAHFLEMVGEFAESEKEYKKAVKLSNGGAVYNNYGAFLCRRNRFKEADKAFHQALEDKQYPRTAEIYENAGLCALKWPDQEKAREYFKTALRRDPNRLTALLELVDIDVKQGEFFEAQSLLDHYKNNAELSARSLWLGIQVAKGLNDDVSVASQALMLKNLFEDSPEYQLYLRSEKATR